MLLPKPDPLYFQPHNAIEHSPDLLQTRSGHLDPDRAMKILTALQDPDRPARAAATSSITRPEELRSRRLENLQLHR
jgi:hypothetical protein